MIAALVGSVSLGYLTFALMVRRLQFWTGKATFTSKVTLSKTSKELGLLLFARVLNQSQPLVFAFDFNSR
jgi:hypothetical protein